ncbi:hypothetical protein AN641_03680 [Candidatus Epulonipiscioides gigas]|nr:hypothetical protein AN641_03680 [Epulopiscium sp. SCG-C07WGA-EpuloA2]
MTEFNVVEQLVSGLGFPIAMVIACSYFIWKMYQAQLGQLAQSTTNNKLFAEAIFQLNLTLEKMQSDIEDIKEHISIN